jgi:putative endonuclease
MPALSFVMPAQAGIQHLDPGLRRGDDTGVKQPCVYILASRRNGTLYIGVTSDLPKRVWEHRSDVVEGFTKRYRVHTLVYYELHMTMEGAITREKQMKEWRRAWKLRLIEKANPDWRDLYEALNQ